MIGLKANKYYFQDIALGEYCKEMCYLVFVNVSLRVDGLSPFSLIVKFWHVY